jgi:3-oxoadipate enol-lactonase
VRFAGLDDLALHYRLDGRPEGTPLVFLNSLGTDLRLWDDVIPEFTEKYSLLRYDKRGHGLSGCPPPPYTLPDHSDDLARILNFLNLKRPVLVGISVGGMIALNYAASHIDQVAGLVLCDTYPKIGTAEMWDERIAALRAQGMAYLAKTILDRWFDPGYADRKPAAFQGYLNMLERMPVMGYTGTCEAIRDADLHALVERITIPVLVLCGQNDMATPPELVRSLAEDLPDARFQIIENAGHLPCVEQPGATAGAIQGFLTEIGYG